MSDIITKLRYPSLGIQNIDEIPVGFYMPWEKSMQSSIPPWWVESNGQLLVDLESVLNGQYIPNLNNVAKTKDVTFTSASATATMTTTKDILAGALVTSSAVPVGTKVLSIDNETTITLDQNATSTGAVSSTLGGNGPVFLAGGSVSGLWLPDQMQGHDHALYGAIDAAAGVNGRTVPTGPGTSNTVTRGAVTDGTNGTPRTGDESFPKHHTVTYVMKVKTSNQTKLVTGFSLQGEEFGGIAEAGTGIKATDRLVVFDPAGGIYKNVYVGRSLTRGIGEYSTDITLTVDSPRLIHVTTAAVDRTITLPVGSTLFPGDEFEIHKVDSGIGMLTVSPAGADTVDWPALSDVTLYSQGNKVSLRWSGSVWTITHLTCNGSNTNGNYVVFSSGLQVCWTWGYITATSSAGQLGSGSLPAAFASTATTIIQAASLGYKDPGAVPASPVDVAAASSQYVGSGRLTSTSAYEVRWDGMLVTNFHFIHSILAIGYTA